MICLGLSARTQPLVFLQSGRLGAIRSAKTIKPCIHHLCAAILRRSQYLDYTAPDGR
jgi:hypothetical protein